MNPIHLAWLSEVALITWRSVKNNQRPPIPSELLATFIAFGSLELLGNSESWNKAAGVTAWGLVIATFMNVVDPLTGKPGKPKSRQEAIASAKQDTGVIQSGGK